VVLTVAVYAGWPVALDVAVARALPCRHVTGLVGFLLSLSRLVADEVHEDPSEGVGVLRSPGVQALDVLLIGRIRPAL